MEPTRPRGPRPKLPGRPGLIAPSSQVKVEGGGKQKHGAAALVPGAYQPPPRTSQQLPGTRKSADNGGRVSLVRPLLMDKAISASALPTPQPSQPPSQR